MPSTENYEVWPCPCAHLLWEQGWLCLLLPMGLRLLEAAVSVWHHLEMLPGHSPDPKSWLIIPNPDLCSSTLARDKLLKVSQLLVMGRREAHQEAWKGHRAWQEAMASAWWWVVRSRARCQQKFIPGLMTEATGD